MSFNFDKVKDADDYIKNIVNGYIHTSQSSLPHKQNQYYIIPPLVGYLIIAYYYNPEYFALFPEDVTINDEKTIVTHNPDGYKDMGISIFGNVKISQKLCSSKFIWTFKISEARPGLAIAIGIDANLAKIVNDLFDCNGSADRPFYAYEAEFYTSYGSTRETAKLNVHVPNDMRVIDVDYGICYAQENKENILKMELDTKNKTLRYFVNEKDQGIAVNNVMLDNDEEYTLAISMDKNVTVQLLQFEQMHQE